MIPRDVLVRLASISLSAAQAEAVASMLSDVEAATRAEGDAIIEAARAKGRARFQKWKAAHPTANVSKREQTIANGSRGGDAHVEDKTLPLENKQNQESKKDALRDVEEFKAELSPHLSEEQIASLLKVRRQKRGVINGHAARLFLAAVAKCNISVSEAADKCVARGWISIEPDWLKPNVRGSPAVIPLKNTVANAAKRRLEELQNARRTRSEIDDHQPALGLVSFDAGRRW